MWPYWLMFLVPALASLKNPHVKAERLAAMKHLKLDAAWFFVFVALSLLIGYRYEVGGDWFNYLRNLDYLYAQSLSTALDLGDPGYQLLAWVSIRNEWGIFGINFICALVFSFGLVVFCRHLPRPWLALTAAVPYLVIVVAMGYTRQGIAIGLAMLGLVALGRQNLWRFVFWVVLAATFHKSAVLLLPIAALAAAKKRLWTAIMVAVVVLVTYMLLLEKSVDMLYANYVESEYQSQGTLVRLVMNAIPAMILLRWRHRFEMSLSQMRLWQWFSVFSLVLIMMFFLSPASTAIDRIALYMLPLQLAVFAYAPEVFGNREGRKDFFIMVVLIYYAAVQLVWLNFATHARYWVPYQNWLLL